MGFNFFLDLMKSELEHNSRVKKVANACKCKRDVVTIFLQYLHVWENLYLWYVYTHPRLHLL